MTDLPSDMSRERIGAPELIVVGEINQQTAAVIPGELDVPDRNFKPV